MSQLTHPRVNAFDLSFELRAWLVAGLAIVAIAIPTGLVIANDDDSSQSAQAAPASGLRYDGGPEEGTRGLSQDDVVSYSERGTDTFGRRP